MQFFHKYMRLALVRPGRLTDLDDIFPTSIATRVFGKRDFEDRVIPFKKVTAIYRKVTLSSSNCKALK